MNNGRETIFREGDETLGGKRKLERERETVAIWLETTRSADVPGTPNLDFPHRRLHKASPMDPWPSVSEPLIPGCGVLHEAILRCAGQEE
jgi:hypothetical protein